MEQRKLIQHGLSSLTMALPSKWIKHYGLKKGDSVFVDQDGSKLHIRTEKTVEIGSVTVDVTQLDRTSALLYIMSLYRFGYNEIEVRYKHPKAIHFRRDKKVTYSSVMHYLMGRLIGMEIVEEKENKIIMKLITKETGDDLDIIIRRVFHLLNEAADTLYEGICEKDLNKIRSIEDKHDNINKFVNYTLRLLNKFGFPDAKKTGYYTHIVANLDKIVDILKYNARDIEDKKHFDKKTLEIWKMVNQGIRAYSDLFFSFSAEKVSKLSENRDKTKEKLVRNAKHIPADELLQLTSMKQILEIILDLTDFRSGLETIR